MRRIVIAAAVATSAWTVAHLRSPAVRAWQPPDLPIRRHGPLSYRTTGPDDADVGIVLLHGLVATGDVFGAIPALLGAQHRVVVPDLLGFGRSLDEHRTDFSTNTHLDTLDALIDHELGDRRIRIGAHSMGSALALRARFGDDVLGRSPMPSPSGTSATVDRKRLGVDAGYPFV